MPPGKTTPAPGSYHPLQDRKITYLTPARQRFFLKTYSPSRRDGGGGGGGNYVRSILHIDIIQLICKINQSTGFYMMAVLAQN